MGLSPAQLQDVCLLYQGAKQCRYLSTDDSTGTFICMKQVAKKKQQIDTQVDKHIANAKANGQDPMQMGRAIGTGNGCKGYLPLRMVEQGYDKNP